MGFRSFAVAALVAAGAACTTTPAREVSAVKSPVHAPASPSVSPSPLRVGKVAPPVVRMFAGTPSSIGAPSRYCLKGQCVDGAPGPSRLVVDAGSIVTFALGRTPERAVAEVSGEGGGKQVLAPATLMAIPGRLRAGSHRIKLSLSWSDASGVWVFDLVAR